MCFGPSTLSAAVATATRSYGVVAPAGGIATIKP